MKGLTSIDNQTIIRDTLHRLRSGEIPATTAAATAALVRESLRDRKLVMQVCIQAGRPVPSELLEYATAQAVQ